MEMSYGDLRRRKRKTRRCLNELRKKSLKNGNSSAKVVKVGTTVNSKHNRVLGVNHGNNYITSSRLTLAILPKAVRSETITRPLLAEIEHEPGKVHINKLLRNKYSSETATVENLENLETNNLCTIFSDDDNEDDVEHERVDRDTLVCKLQSPAIVASDGASSGPPSPSAAPATRVYDQFIKNIPEYIEMHAPSFLKGDAAKKPLAIFHKMYLKAHQSDSDQEIEVKAESSDCLEGLSESCSSPACLSRSPSPSRQESRMQEDTPDYKYFPHKLNQ